MEPNEIHLTPRNTYHQVIQLQGAKAVIESSEDDNDPWKFQSRNVRHYGFEDDYVAIVRETYTNENTNELRTVEFVLGPEPKLEITTSKLEDPNKAMLDAFKGMMGNLTDKMGTPPARRSPEEEAEYMARMQIALAGQLDAIQTNLDPIPVRCQLKGNPSMQGITHNVPAPDGTVIVLWDGFEQAAIVPIDTIEFLPA